MTADTRLMLLEKRKYSEREGLKNDIVLWKKTLPPKTVIHHHVSQFEALSNWMIDRLDGLFESNPARWPNLDPSTFNSLIVSILSGKWVLLRQVAQQRAPSSPYLEAAKSLDEYADQCYQRLRAVLKQNCGLNGISESSPLVYLGPIARLFLFDEEAPCLISAPFAAANDMDEHGRELSRQTIPHEVGHAIFDQIAGMVDELKYIINTSLSGPGSNKKQDVIRSVILNWLEEMIADMAGTAVGGLSFAESARRLTVMPARMAGVTDAEHPIPLLRVFVHGWVLDQTDPEAASTFNRLLNEQITDQVNRPFESLPAVITATMQEVKIELLKVVDVVWKGKLKTLHDHSIGEVLLAASKLDAPSRQGRVLPDWGERPGKGEELIFRLVGPSGFSSPLPGLGQYADSICCPLRLPICCSTLS